MSFGTRLRERREALGLKQSELGKLLGVTGSAIGNYENGISSPKADILYQVFDVLKCDANYLFQDEMRELQADDFTVPEIKLVKKYRSLDSYGKDMVDTVLNKEHSRCLSQAELTEEVIPFGSRSVAMYDLPVSAGTGVFLQDDKYEFIDIPASGPLAKASFALRVSGDSMEPNYYDGDIVAIQKADAVDPGEIGIFVVNGGGYMKRYGGNGHLISLNRTYPDIIISDDDCFKILGRVLGKVK